MLKIAITGNIASGKTAVENILKEKGYEVYDTDIIAHKILDSSTDVLLAFSDDDILTNGKINRKKLGKIVFSDKEKLKKLESIIHPQVKLELEKIFSKSETVVFISVPQLYESGFEKIFDKVIFVTSDENIRLERLMKRNNLSKEEATIRINAQIPQEEKILKSDFVINNNISIEDLKDSVNNVLKQLQL